MVICNSLVAALNARTLCSIQTFTIRSPLSFRAVQHICSLEMIFTIVTRDSPTWTSLPLTLGMTIVGCAAHTHEKQDRGKDYRGGHRVHALASLLTRVAEVREWIKQLLVRPQFFQRESVALEVRLKVGIVSLDLYIISLERFRYSLAHRT